MTLNEKNLEPMKKKSLTFSQRMGIKPIKKSTDDIPIDEDLRNQLWNALSQF